MHVAPPTGERETDRASILAALEQVEPGGTIPFGPADERVRGKVTGLVPRSNSWHDPSPHRVRLIAVEPGISLEVLDWGDIGEALIFLSGAGDSAHSFDEFAPRFRDAFRVLAITRRGFGASSQPEKGYDALQRARDVVAVLDSLGIDRAVLAGHSFGGDELTHVATAYPERVHALVYLDAYDYGGGLLQRLGEIQWPAPAPMLAEDSASVAAVQTYFSRERGVDILEAEIRASGRFDDTGRWAGWLDAPGVLRQTMEGVTAYDYSSIDAPALAVYAQSQSAAELFPRYAEYDDEARTLADRSFSEMQPYIQASIERFRSEVSQGETLFLPGAHHYVHYSNPVEVERAMRDFLAPFVWPAGADTVHVAPPTGEREIDRASILAALEEVQPGETVLFAPGTYLMGGEIIRVTVPRITLQGHPEGTTLRGCNPDEFPMEDPFEFGNNCNGIELAGGWQTVRDLTFEHAFWALHVGCCWDGFPNMRSGEGGHLIEGNTFRSSSNAVRVHGFWSEPTVIQNNRFLNNWHTVGIYGNTVHLLDNDIAVPEPEEVQLLGFPAEAISIVRPMNLHDSGDWVARTCENNVIAGNRIDGTTEGIMITSDEPETPCRHNVIRENTITIRRARPAVIPGFIRVHDDTDPTVVGVPLALRGAVTDNLIEGNVINGADGLGIEIRNASRNRIVTNTVTRVERREPFPGNAIAAMPILGGDPETWRDANGSGIWISPGSDGNEISDNTFEEIASWPVVLEGDSNIVQLRNGADAVHDLGSGNRITGPDQKR